MRIPDDDELQELCSDCEQKDDCGVDPRECWVGMVADAAYGRLVDK